MIQDLLNNAVVYALGWTLVHSLWWALFLALITRLIFTKVNAGKAEWRYRLSLAALAGVLAGAVVIFVHYYQQFEGLPMEAELPVAGPGDTVVFDWEQFLAGGSHQATFTWEQVSQQLERYFPPLVFLWLLGAVFMGFRLAGSWLFLRRLGTQGVQAPTEEWNRLFNHLCSKMGIRRPVRLYWSKRVQEPITLRHLKPVVLFPLGLLTQLSPEQIEIVLLHELAHIKRWDYLVNWLQSLLELLFFYHPAVWWLSAQVRTAREHCCDDLVLQADQGQRMLYAQTLTQMSAYSLNLKTKLAMSYNGDNQSFTFRVKRLFGQVDQNRSWQKPILSGLLLLVFLALILVNTTHLLADNNPNTMTKEELLNLLDPEIRNWVLDEEIPVLDTIPEGEKKKVDQSSLIEASESLFGLKKEFQQKAIYLDGVFQGVGKEGLRKIDKSKIQFWSELQPGALTLEKYGPEAKNGAVDFITKPMEKRGVITRGDTLVVHRYDNNTDLPIFDIIPNGDTLPAYFLDGKRIGDEHLDGFFNLPPDKIDQVEVIKGKEAIIDGIRHPEGAVMVYTKAYAKKMAVAQKVVPKVKSEMEEPLVIIDGVRQGFGKDKIAHLKPEEIESVNVLKGETAAGKYGEDGQHGVIEVTTKGQRSVGEKEEIEIPSSTKIRIRQPENNEDPLFVVDGKVIGKGKTKLEYLDPMDIESINVLKGESAVVKYGDDGQNGVVVVQTKNARPISTEMKLDKNLKKSTFKFGPKGDTEKMDPLVVFNNQPIGKASKVGKQFKEGEGHMITFSGPTKDLIEKYGAEAKEGVVFVTQYFERPVEQAGNLDEAMVYINGEKKGLWKEIGPSLDQNQIETVSIIGKDYLPAEYAESPTDIVLVKLKGFKELSDTQLKVPAEQPALAIQPVGNMEVFPNPFQGNMQIRFRLEKAAPTKVSVFNAQGQLVKVIQDDVLVAGPHQVDWEAAHVPIGNYTVVLESGDLRVSKTVVKQ